MINENLKAKKEVYIIGTRRLGYMRAKPRLLARSRDDKSMSDPSQILTLVKSSIIGYIGPLKLKLNMVPSTSTSYLRALTPI